MMRWLLILLLLPWAAADMRIYIEISPNGLVSEHVVMHPEPGQDNAEFIVQQEPLSISGEYEIYAFDEYYTIVFPYSNEVEFTMLLDGMIERHGRRRVFRTSFDGSTDLSVTLPRGNVLASMKPNVLPKPDEIITDGERITVRWSLDNEPVSVFYEGPSNAAWITVVVILVALGCLVSAFIVMLRKKQGQVHDMLSEDEKSVLAELKRQDRQDKIAKELGFSKSKMSKVLRKLEEKKLVAKEPYFKTNKIKKI